MAVPIALTSMADKRARYLAEARYHLERARKAVDAVAKLDAAIALWDERDELVEVRRLYREHPGPFAWSKMTENIVNVLHAAPRGLTTTEVQLVLIRQAWHRGRSSGAQTAFRTRQCRPERSAPQCRARPGRDATRPGRVPDRPRWRRRERPQASREDKSQERRTGKAAAGGTGRSAPEPSHQALWLAQVV
jgi:hypothetical protein